MSNAQAVAFLSFGLIVSGSATFPSPYDVRFGVDNGEGQLGTLTSPATYDVRIGVQYGGNGTQYTGTLYVAPSGVITTWTQDALELWEDLVAEFGARATYQAWTFDCVRNPIKQGFSMELAGYNTKADTIIDMLRTQAVLMGLYGLKQENPPTKRPILTSDGYTFQVMSMENDDTAQPSVRFMCLKLQAAG